MTDDEKWNAVAENDERYDGVFYYAVKTTGLFCRPSCRSKLPLRENVEYFDCVQDALAAGYKICKRCRPDLMEYRPEREIAQKMKEIIEQYFNLRVALQKQIRELGLSEHRITEIFKEEYGVTPFKCRKVVFGNDFVGKLKHLCGCFRVKGDVYKRQLCNCTCQTAHI